MKRCTCPIHGKQEDYTSQTYSRVQRAQRPQPKEERTYKKSSSVEKTRTINREGVIREKRNYILFERVLGTEKERQDKFEKTEEKKAPLRAQPKPKVEEEKPKLVKKTEIIDNYEYKESVTNKKIDPRRKSITIHQRLSEPFVRETYEAEYPGKKNETKERKQEEKKQEGLRGQKKKSTFEEDDDDADNYRYHESKNIRKPGKRESIVIHKRRSSGKNF